MLPPLGMANNLAGGGISCPARVAKCTLLTYLPIACRYITYINTVNALAMIPAGCDGHDTLFNTVVKGLFAD